MVILDNFVKLHCCFEDKRVCQVFHTVFEIGSSHEVKGQFVWVLVKILF